MWRNCPVAWNIQYKGKEKGPMVTLEAIDDCKLWIWLAYFGLPGFLNDINVLESSMLRSKIATGRHQPLLEFLIDGLRRNKPYLLAELIYPKWPIFQHTCSEP